MAQEIAVTIWTMDGTSKIIDTPSDMKTQHFIDQVVSALNLPKYDANGQTNKWNLINKVAGKGQLDPTRTLQDNDVEHGTQLSMIREVVAGRQ